MALLMAYGAVYILLFSLFRNIGFSRSIFRLPQGTGFLSTLISMLTTNIGLSGFGMISAMVLLQGEVGIWFILAIFLGTGMKIFFFGPLWAQFDWANENHFILRRFAPKWGQVLHSFRGIYVGLLVNAIVISGMMIAFADMMHAYAGIPRQPALYFSFVFLLINLSRNSLSSKIFSDTYNFVLLILVLVTGLVLSGGILSDVQLMNKDARATFGAFPYTDTPFFKHFLLYVGIQWWSAQMFDGSGVNAQRLMGFSDRKIKALMVTYYSVLIIFYMSIALIAIKALPLLGEEHIPEQAFFVFMKTYIPNNVSWLIPLLIFGVFAATVESQLNWAGSLLDSVTSDKWKQRSWTPYIMMGIVGAAAIGCTLVFDRILFVINFILGISAGVSLIFILRWFTPRINAQVQLSAMVGAVIYTFLVKIAGKVWFPELSDIDQQLYLMITVTVLVLTTAVLVSVLTYKKEDREAYFAFRQSVHFPSPVVPLLMKAALVGITITLVGFGLFRMMAG